MAVAIFQHIKNLGYLDIGGKRLENLMSQKVFRLKMFDLFDQLLLGVLNVDFVDTLAVFQACCAPFARRPTITLSSIREGFPAIEN